MISNERRATMKKLVMLALFFSIVAIPCVYAGHNSIVVAQEKSPAAPVIQPVSEPTSTKPAEKLSAASTPSVQDTTSHKDYAAMNVKECAECHKGSGAAPTHGAYWVKEHGQVASKARKNCVECHGQSFCLDCHKGGGIDADLKISNYRTSYIPASHRTDFRELHPLKALDNPQTCYRCHNQRYCTECHSKFRGTDLTVQSHRRSWSDGTFQNGIAHSGFAPGSCQGCHPGGILSQYIWSSDHAREARRNLQSCQTCHSDGAVCMTCHSARTGLRVNPHPRNWDRVKDKYRSKSGGRSCVKCHDNF
jgi:hypothetical protein